MLSSVVDTIFICVLLWSWTF